MLRPLDVRNTTPQDHDPEVAWSALAYVLENPQRRNYIKTHLPERRKGAYLKSQDCGRKTASDINAWEILRGRKD